MIRYLARRGGYYGETDDDTLWCDMVSGAVAEVEIILSRRNPFGPLHDAEKERYWNWPGHWITEGDEFEPNPVLIPSGLLAAPEFL